MSAVSTAGSVTSQRRRPWWRFVRLNNGISLSSAISVFLIAYLANMAFGAVGHLNPYVLQSHLSVAPNTQGSITGMLTSVQELVAILVSGVVGVYADRIGRRPLLVVGGALISAGFIAVILTTNVPGLVAARALFALGMAMLATTLLILHGDYPTADSRGRWMGLVSFAQAGGSFTAAMTVTRLPGAFERAAGNPLLAFVGTFAVCMLIGVAIAVIARFGIRAADNFRGTGVRPNALRHLRAGLSEARNPDVALSYMASIASKADLVVVTGFLFLWTVRFATDHGLPVDAGLATGRGLMAAAQITFIFSAPLLGFVLDRLDPRKGVLLSFSMASVAYLLMGLVDDPTSAGVMIRGMFVGFCEAAALISAFVLLAARVTTSNRTVVTGMFVTCGAVGMLAGAAIAGLLFDHWRYSAPYLMMAILNFGVATFACVLWLRDRRAS